MPSKEQAVALARVLVALAWADGKVSQEELNFLKDFLFKFELTGEEWARIEMYLEDPVPPDEAEALVRDLIQKLGSPENRQSVLTALEGLMHADGVCSDSERELLERLSTVLMQAGSASVIMGRVKGLFRQTVFKPVEGSKRSEDLHEFLNNRLLFKIRRKLEREKLSLENRPEALAYAALFGGLLAHVAAAHDSIDEREQAVLCEQLKKIGGFDEEAVEIILSVIGDAAAQGLDRFRLTREFHAKSTPEQRRQLLDCLFEIAAADTDLQHAELEEVRGIATALRISHSEFIGAKMKALEKIRSEKP